MEDPCSREGQNEVRHEEVEADTEDEDDGEAEEGVSIHKQQVENYQYMQAAAAEEEEQEEHTLGTAALVPDTILEGEDGDDDLAAVAACGSCLDQRTVEEEAAAEDHIW